MKELREFYERTLSKIKVEMESVSLAINAMESGLKETQSIDSPKIAGCATPAQIRREI